MHTHWATVYIKWDKFLAELLSQFYVHLKLFYVYFLLNVVLVIESKALWMPRPTLFWWLELHRYYVSLIKLNCLPNKAKTEAVIIPTTSGEYWFF